MRLRPILVLTALQDELDAARAPDGIAVVYTGVGKLNAAHAAIDAIGRLNPALVVNYGTAGKINPGLNGLLDVATVIQRDMMAMPLAPRGRTPYAPELDRLVAAGVEDGVLCGTGDSFVTTTDPWLVENAVDIVDMELFAIADACRRQHIPWRAFKFITDDANDFAAEHWTANVANGEDLFWDALQSIVRA
jgi:adenosylhomocysteine nucleosidase